MTGPHDVPTATELLAAVREFLDEVRDSTEGRIQFHARVAANVVAMVEREMVLGPAQAAAHAAGLARLGYRDDAALARAIREGDVDERVAEVAREIRATVAAKLLVANPGYAPDLPSVRP